MKAEYLRNLNNLLASMRKFYKVKSVTAGVTELEEKYKENKIKYSHLDLDDIFRIIKQDPKLVSSDNNKMRALRTAVSTLLLSLDSKHRELGPNFPQYLQEFRSLIEKFWQALMAIPSDEKHIVKAQLL